MTLTHEFRERIKVAAGSNFEVKVPMKNTILFRNLKLKLHDFYLYCGQLTEFEILEIAGILEEVFSEVPADTVVSASSRPLNSDSEESCRLVRAIIDLEGSALHKLLLLVSADSLLEKVGVDFVMTLAQLKSEFCSDLEEIVKADLNLFNDLKNLYILPGVSAMTVLPVREKFDMDKSQRETVEMSCRLTSFFATNSENLTLDDQLKRDFVDAVRAKSQLGNFHHINSIRKLLLSEYRDLALSMTASELSSLSSLLSDLIEGHFPKDILRNRALAKCKSDLIYDNLPRSGSTNKVDVVFRYLSPDEASVLNESAFEYEFESLLSNANLFIDRTHQIVHAALAEVLAVKGVHKALEVARSLEHLRLASDLGLSHYEATIALIAEALNPENDNLPFGWAAQLSEYGWVLTSHLQENELFEVAL